MIESKGDYTSLGINLYNKVKYWRCIKMNIRIAGIHKYSVVDGTGIRYTVFTQGCNHNCLGCHNKDTHRLDGGMSVSIDDIVDDIKSLRYFNGITLSGGDPFLQSMECVELIQKVNNVKKCSTWCYTGYTFEELLSSGDNKKLSLLDSVDVLVDGRFEKDKKTLDVAFVGSYNQRVIDVKKSLSNHCITLWV